MVAATVGPGGTDGLVDGPSRLAPYRYGWNAIQIDIGRASELSVQLEGDSVGSRRSAAQWGAKLVVSTRGSRTYHDLDFEGDSGSLTLTGLDGQTVWLVVAPWTSQTRYFDSETFAYQYAVSIGGDDPDEPGDTGDEPIEDTGGSDGGTTDADTESGDTADPAGDTTDRVEGGAKGGAEGGCAVASVTATSALWLGGLLAAGRRRKSTVPER